MHLIKETNSTVIYFIEIFQFLYTLNKNLLFYRPGQFDNELLIILPPPESINVIKRSWNVSIIIPLSLKLYILCFIGLRPASLLTADLVALSPLSSKVGHVSLKLQCKSKHSSKEGGCLRSVKLLFSNPIYSTCRLDQF